MQNFELVHFASPDELARAVAKAWVDEIEIANRLKAPHDVALSGGRITQKFLKAVEWDQSTCKRKVSLTAR